MNSQLALSRSDLEFAESALRDILAGDLQRESKADAKALSSILVHLVNMNEAIIVSPEHHLNVVKRLHDFAATADRMAARNPAAAAKLARLSAALRATSLRLSELP